MRTRAMGSGRCVAAMAPLVALMGCGGDPEVQRLENPRTESACACLTSSQLGLMNDCALSMTADVVGVEGSDPDGAALDLQVLEEDGTLIHQEKLQVEGTTVRWSWTPNLPLADRRAPLTTLVRSVIDDTSGTALQLTTEVVNPSTPGPFVLCASWLDPAGTPVARDASFSVALDLGLQARLYGDVQTPFNLEFSVFEDDEFTEDDPIESVPVTLTLDSTTATSTWLTVPQPDDPGDDSEYYFSATTTITGEAMPFDTTNSLVIFVR